MYFLSETLNFISTYGYLAVFLGSVFEGETWMVLAGLFSHQGHLNFCWVLVFAWLGAVTGDTFWFIVGRYHLFRFLDKWNWFKEKENKSLTLINKKPRTLAFTMRFMYGFRTLIPIGLGMSKISNRDFFIYNISGALVWVLLYGTLGYFFGEFLETAFGRIKFKELIQITVVILLVVGFINLTKYIRAKLQK